MLEAESEKLLNCADMTAQEMQEFYPQLLHPADPDQMDKAVEGKVNSCAALRSIWQRRI